MFDFYALNKAIFVFVLTVLLTIGYIYLNIVFVAPNIQLEPTVMIFLGLVFLCFYLPVITYGAHSHLNIKGVN